MVKGNACKKSLPQFFLLQAPRRGSLVIPLNDAYWINMFFGIVIAICIDGQTHASHVVMMPLLPGLCPYEAMEKNTCSTLGQEAGVRSGRTAVLCC